MLGEISSGKKHVLIESGVLFPWQKVCTELGRGKMPQAHEGAPGLFSRRKRFTLVAFLEQWRIR